LACTCFLASSKLIPESIVYVVLSVFLKTSATIPESSKMAIVRSLSLLICDKYATNAMRAIIMIGLKNVITIKDLFFTLFKYSLCIMRDKWFILIVFYGLNKNIISTWNHFHKMMHFCFGC